jgi:hypothetical protein
MLEKQHVEDPVVRHAVSLGFEHRKMNGMGAKSWPDQQFFVPGGKSFFIEFKKPNGKPTPKQSEKHRQLRALGFDVYVCDNPTKGKAIIDSYAPKSGKGGQSLRRPAVVARTVSDSRDKATPRQRRVCAVLRSRAAKNQHYASRFQDSG